MDNRAGTFAAVMGWRSWTGPAPRAAAPASADNCRGDEVFSQFLHEAVGMNALVVVVPVAGNSSPNFGTGPADFRYP